METNPNHPSPELPGTSESLKALAPEIFKGIPEAVYGGRKLFIRECHRMADNALKVCRTCKHSAHVTMAAEPGFGNSYAFNVRCTRCKRASDGFPVTKDSEHSKLAMMRSLAAAVDSWNNINMR